ncbi:MAG TPA: IS3 family transposase [Roseiarcus sp.]|jgi:transposase InsO family protein
MGRHAPRERRAHLFAVIEKVTREGSQGETKATVGLVARFCAIACLSRASYYRWLEPKLSARDDADLRDVIQRLALKRRHEGYRRITRRLRDEGLHVNAKRVLRLMRADNLLSLRRRPFVASTTDSRHPFPIAPNLARALVPTGLDQLWVADITYVRLAEAFVYLAVVVDAFSRKVVGWALDAHLEARLAVEALDRAIAARDPAPGLVHHSDRGVQYASGEYGARLDERGFQRSMSRPGNPYDNAKAESFMKTLKAEEANGTAYVDLNDARARIGAFIEDVYNADRLHSALDYKSPIAFEADLRKTAERDRQTLTALSPN